MNKELTAASLIIVTLFFVSGLGLAYFQAPDGERCSEIAERWEANQTIPATMSCYPPGVLNVESDSTPDRTEKQCACRAVANGEVKVLTISVPDF